MIEQRRLWFDTHRKYLRQSGVTRAVILDNGDLASTRIFLEVRSNRLTLESILLTSGGAAFASAYLAYVLLRGNVLPLGIAFWVFLVVFCLIALSLRSLVHQRRYRVVVSYADWLQLPAHLLPLDDALDLAANLSSGYETTNRELIRAMLKTGVAEISKRPSAWDMARLKTRRARRAA